MAWAPWNELERNLIKERVEMGLERARKQGKRLGQPNRIFDREKALMLLQTMSRPEVARQLGQPRGWSNRAAQRGNPPGSPPD